MKINNPRSMVDFSRDTNQNSIAQNLATVGQLYTIANKLTAKFENKLKGVNEAGLDGMTNCTTGGGYGYAWLGADGKLSPSLLPAIAISETHVVSEEELRLYATSTVNGVTIPPCEHYNQDRAEYFLHNYLTFNTQPKEKNPNSKNLSIQKGDIIVVHPGTIQTVNGKEIPDEFYNTQEANTKTVVPDVRFSGSYIIYDVENDASNGTSKFFVVKISYTDGNIVKVNDLSPSNSAGELNLNLTDILRHTLMITNADAARTNPVELTEAVGRLSFGLGDDRGRFYFIDNSNDNPQYIAYTKLSEHEDLSGQVYSISSTLSSIIANYKLEHNADVESLTNQIFATSSLISSDFRTDISGIQMTIGDRTASAGRNINDAIFPQLKGLREDIETNLTLLNNTRCDTNDYLALIRTNIKELYTNLNQHAVQMLSVSAEWPTPIEVTDQFSLDNSKLSAVFVSTVSPLVKYENAVMGNADELGPSEYINIADYSKASVKGIGYRRWTLHYNPTKAADWAANEYPEERILAVFDNSNLTTAQGEQIFPDIRYSIFNNHIITHISIDVEVTDENDLGSIAGTAWTLFVAKTIGGIKNTLGTAENELSFNVGGVAEGTHVEHYQDTTVGNHSGSNI